MKIKHYKGRLATGIEVAKYHSNIKKQNIITVSSIVSIVAFIITLFVVV